MGRLERQGHKLQTSRSACVLRQEFGRTTSKRLAWMDGWLDGDDEWHLAPSPLPTIVRRSHCADTDDDVSELLHALGGVHYVSVW
jgi:hypothetical protein